MDWVLGEWIVGLAEDKQEKGVIGMGIETWTASLRSVVAKATPSFRRYCVAPQKKYLYMGHRYWD